MKLGDKVKKIAEKGDEKHANKRNDPNFRKGCVLTVRNIIRLPSGNKYLEFEENEHSSPIEDFEVVK
jgi:hypothetical protein